MLAITKHRQSLDALVDVLTSHMDAGLFISNEMRGVLSESIQRLWWLLVGAGIGQFSIHYVFIPYADTRRKVDEYRLKWHTLAR